MADDVIGCSRQLACTTEDLSDLLKTANVRHHVAHLHKEATSSGTI
jgi:hypothetical protein